VDQDFNAGRFLDYNKFASEKELIDCMLEIDQNEELAIDMLMQPTFSPDRLSHEAERERVLHILDTIMEHPGKPIARQWLRHVHKAKLFYEKNKKRIVTRFKLT
jgi:hypothetical protein